MMLVAATGFGGVWCRRFGKNPNDSSRFANAAYYNTTGMKVDGGIRTPAKMIGHVRFSGVGGFNPNNPSRMINRVFECPEPCVRQGQNKALFKRLVTALVQPEYFLVVVKHDEVGHLEFGDTRWKSGATLVLSFSECREQQEAMLLMAQYPGMRGGLGTFFLEPRPQEPWAAALRPGDRA